MIITENILWIVFGLVVIGLLALDLGIFQRKAHASGMKEAVALTAFYVVISLMFAGMVYVWLGSDKSFEFLTAYIVEKSLSVDNLFVFIIIFSYFNVSLKYQHKVLFWGILGALITRGIFIFAGVTLIKLIHPLIYVFGAFLIYTSIKVIRGVDPEVNPEKNFILRHIGKYLPLKKDYIGGNFFIKENLKWFVTPLFIVLMVIESTDVMFATDSVPAVISITQDTFIVYTSNIFAILGLRALYFVISSTMTKFDYLNYGVGIVLAFIGVKMLTSEFYKIPTALSLIIVVSILTLSVAASLIWKKEETEKQAGE